MALEGSSPEGLAGRVSLEQRSEAHKDGPNVLLFLDGEVQLLQELLRKVAQLLHVAKQGPNLV